MSASHPLLADSYRTALVTGASSGIGKAIAFALLQQGIQVYGTSRHPDKAGLPAELDWLLFEGASKDGVDAFIEHHSELLSKCDVLVNNSGSSYFGKASEIPDTERKRQHHLLYEAPVRLTEQVLASMRERRHGAIVNVSSLAALFTIPYLEDYSRSKERLSTYTQSLIASGKSSGLVVIDFLPGDYRTGFNSNLRRYGEADAESDVVWRQLEKNLRKAPGPEKAANDVIAALATGKSATVTSGTFFQSKIAPAGHRCLPGWLVEWAIRKYYRI